MARVTPEGVIGRDLSYYIDRLGAEFRQLAASGDLDLSPETPQGQVISIMALESAEEDEEFVLAANANSLAHALGIQLDDLGSLPGIDRRLATPSVVDVSFSGDVGTTVPARTRAKTLDGDEFWSIADVLIPAAGNVAARMESVVPGPIPAPAGSLISLVSRVAGLRGVANAQDAALGTDGESNVAYRRRISLAAAHAGRGTVAAIAAGVIQAGADRVRVEENDTASSVTRQTVAIAANSVMAIVRGGPDTDIGAAVAEYKTPGVGMVGDTTAGGGKFQRVTDVAIRVAFSISTTSEFPPDGLARMKRNLVDYAAGTWHSGAGDFDTSGFRIGESIDSRRLQAPVLAVPGHSITAWAVTDTASTPAALPAVTPLDRLYTLEEANIAITII